MNTTFGVKIPKEQSLDNEEKTIEIAFRNNNGKFRWLNDLAKILPNDTPVIPLDNSAQGIFTVGDIRKEINELGLNVL